MGTDIHVCVEEKLFEDQDHPWHLAWTPDIWRDYDLFRLLAGVRAREDEWIIPVAEPRGLPSGVTEKTREYLDKYADHSISWISREEFLHFFPWLQSWHEMTDFAIAGYAAVKHAMPYGTIRIVFGFDH